DVPGETTYDSRGNKIYAKLYGGKVNNQVEKAHKFEQLHKKAKNLIDSNGGNLGLNEIQSSYGNIIVSLAKYQNNNGEFVTSLKSGWEIELKPKLDIYAKYLVEYKLANDTIFLNNFNNEVTRQKNIAINEKELQLGRSLTAVEKQEQINEISKGIKDGIIKATSDYLMQYIELAKDLKNLTINDVYNGLGSVWSIISNPINSIVTISQNFKDGINKTLNKLEHLGAYEYSFGTSYIGTSVGFVVGVPGSKIINLGKLDNIVIKIDKTIDGLITNLLNNNIKRLGAGYVTKFNSLNTKIVSSFSVEKQERFFKRMALMDNFMLKEYLDNSNNYYTNNFEVGGKYNMLISIDETGKRIVPNINNSGKYVDGYGNIIRGNIDFIVTKNSNGEYWIQFGEKHSYLSNGNNLVYAGNMSYTEGVLNNWSNWSGHYRPSKNDIDGINATKSAFKNRMGIELNVAFNPR
ncbi:MAG: hypothetical protein Q8K30_00940, partial [Candidatus Gracilibacteria bacterium]|nr:hypothetical protein [Candidatus Gracilibacteria bacterium]